MAEVAHVWPPVRCAEVWSQGVYSFYKQIINIYIYNIYTYHTFTVIYIS